MTPFQKADNIISKFRYTSIGDYKKLALIVVDEIIESRENDKNFDDTLSSTSSEYYSPHPMYLTYWLKVKEEIEKYVLTTECDGAIYILTPESYTSIPNIKI
jgi:hypothetical protein